MASHVCFNPHLSPMHCLGGGNILIGELLLAFHVRVREKSLPEQMMQRVTGQPQFHLVIKGKQIQSLRKETEAFC